MQAKQDGPGGVRRNRPLLVVAQRRHWENRSRVTVVLTIALEDRIPAVFDFVVVGLGAIGSATTASLAGRGHRVLGLDRFAPPHALGSSHGDTRLFREACYQGSHYSPLVDASYESWARLGSESDRELMRPARALLVGRPDGEALADCLASIRAQKDRFEELTSDDVAERFPSFRLAPDMIAILESRAGILNPEACIEATLSRARANGAELRTDEPVLGWGAEADGLRVRTDLGEYRARRLVLAVGAWTRNLAPELDLPIEIERTVQYWLEPAAAVEERFAADDCPAWVWEHETESMWYGFPRTERGVKVGLHRHAGRRADPNAIDRAVGGDEEASMRRVLGRFMPDALGRRVDASVCMYTTTPDAAPILDRHPDFPAVTIFTGGSGHCFKFALVLGRLLADLAADDEPELALAPFFIERF